MENKVYKFRRIGKVLKNHSIANMVSNGVLPKLKIAKKRKKVQEMIRNYTNISNMQMLGKTKEEFPYGKSLTPKLRSISTKMGKCHIGRSNVFLRRTPEIQKHVNVRYLNKDFDDIEEINTMKTPDDSSRSTKNNFFIDIIPEFLEILGNSKSIPMKNQELNMYSSKCFIESTRCGSKPSDSLSKGL